MLNRRDAIKAGSAPALASTLGDPPLQLDGVGPAVVPPFLVGIADRRLQDGPALTVAPLVQDALLGVERERLGADGVGLPDVEEGACGHWLTTIDHRPIPLIDRKTYPSVSIVTTCEPR